MRLSLLVLALALVGCAEAQTSTVIADGRSFQTDTDALSPADADAWAARPSVRQAMAEARRFYQKMQPGYENENEAGDVGVMAVVDGAFTTPGADQHAVLYRMSPWPRCCPKMGIAVVEGDRLVRNVAFQDTDHDLRVVPDLDGDGLDGLVLDGGFGMGGQESTSITVVHFTPDGAVSLGTTGTYDGACGAMHDGETATVVRIAPGPTFTAQTFQKATCDSTTWTADGPPQPLTLTPPDENPFETLSGAR